MAVSILYPSNRFIQSQQHANSVEMLLRELDGVVWDVVVIQETWRELRSEVLHLESGHVWYGSGGCRGSCGVGFLVNKRFGKCKFNPVSSRLATLQMDCFCDRICIIGVYMPDGSHADDAVEEVYCKMDELVRVARASCRQLIYLAISMPKLAHNMKQMILP